MRASAIGPFQIEAVAGAGSTGTVYQALDPASGRRVAVKVLRGLAGAEAARFAREARLLAQIRHPGVVRYVDHGTTDEGDAYLVMEWLEGEDLRERLRRAGISIEETVLLGRRVAEALAAVHALGIVHRDIKPANIFLPAGVPADAKIVDFGLVRGRDASADLTRTGTVVGTPSYMSPEQARGHRSVDARADVFSLGCVLYKCLTGRSPFEGESVLSVLTKVLLEEAAPPRALRSAVPPALDDLVRRMMAKDPHQRPPSAAAVAAALAAIAPADEGVEAAPAPGSASIAGLTRGEQRVSAVLLIGADPEAPPPGDETQPSAPKGAAPVDVSAIVEEHGGQVDSILGGAHVATFSGSALASDQAAQAARCALALRAALPGAPMAIATGRSTMGAPPASQTTPPPPSSLRSTMGAPSASQTTPPPPSSLRSEVGQGPRAGDAVDRAAALLALSSTMNGASASGAAAPPPPIRLDETTAALLGSRFVVERAGRDGGDARAPVGDIRLVGRSAVPAAPTLLGRRTPMVGREWELASIRTFLGTCIEEREPRAILVTGAPGMGKSRLAAEAVTMLRHLYPDVLVWCGRSDPLRSGSALGILAQIVRDAVGMDEVSALEATDARRRVFSERIAAWVKPPAWPVADRAWMTEVLGEVAGVPFPDDQSPALRAARQDAHIMSEQVRAAWEALVEGASGAAPVVVVIEDAQWADAPSMRLVVGALESLAQGPWMVLALARPEVHESFPHLREMHGLQEIRLGPLPRRAGESLVRAVIDDAGAETVERLVQRADGHPFYLEELIRGLVEGPGARGGTGLVPVDPRTSTEAHGALPGSVLAMVDARLGALDASTRRILRAASVFGEVFWPGGVVALLGGAAPPPGWIDDLLDMELIMARPASRFAGERELAFRHALWCEGAYASLTEGDRVLGHALAGEWLERHGETDVTVLARHFTLGHEEARAAGFYLAAATQALRAADVDAALARAKEALAHTSSEPARIACLRVLGEAHLWRDDAIQVMAHAEDLARLAAPGSGPWIDAMQWKQSSALVLGRMDALLSAVMALIATEGEPGTAPALAAALAGTVFILALGAQWALAAQAVAKMDALVAAAEAGDPRVQAPTDLAHVWVAGWRDGDAWPALRHARAAVAGLEETRDARHLRFARIFLAVSLWQLGLFPEADAELPADAARPSDLVGFTAGLYRGLILVDRGQLDEVRAIAARRIELAGADRANDPLRVAEAHLLFGEAAARAGDLATAERELAESLPGLLLVSILWQAVAARLVAVRLARGRVAEAIALDRDLHASFSASGGHGLRGTLVRLVHAEALAAAGDRDAARAALGEARADLEARAARIEDPDVHRRFLADVPENARVLALTEAWAGDDDRQANPATGCGT
jgi:hypothetical protein